jgi:hypothetical protein
MAPFMHRHRPLAVSSTTGPFLHPVAVLDPPAAAAASDMFGQTASAVLTAWMADTGGAANRIAARKISDLCKIPDGAHRDSGPRLTE